MNLIYRANIYAFAPAKQRFMQPRAINWRYQVFGDVQMNPVAALVTQQNSPRAINWRYQVAAL